MKISFTHSLKLSAFFLAVLILNLSCKDDKVIPEILPVIETMTITQDREYPPPYESLFTNNFRVLVKEKGNVEVVDYGVLFTTYYGSELQNKLPYVVKQLTVLNCSKNIIKEEFGEGVKLMRREKHYPLRTYVYQRAYAELKDGRVIYGDLVLTAAGGVIDFF